MTTRKRFEFEAPASPDAPPVEFELYGEVFTVPRDIPGLSMMELAVAHDAAQDESTSENEAMAGAMAAWARFLHSVLGPANYGRFRKLAMANRMSGAQLMELGQWLIEEVAGAPLDELSRSPEQPPIGTSNSTAVPPYPGHLR